MSSSTRKDFTGVISLLRNYRKYKYIILCLQKQSASKGLIPQYCSWGTECASSMLFTEIHGMVHCCTLYMSNNRHILKPNTHHSDSLIVTRSIEVCHIDIIHYLQWWLKFVWTVHTCTITVRNIALLFLPFFSVSLSLFTGWLLISVIAGCSILNKTGLKINSPESWQVITLSYLTQMSYWYSDNSRLSLA